MYVLFVDYIIIRMFCWISFIHICVDPLTMFFPYLIFTVGRPGGPAFYISIMDNVENHGPGSQGSKSEVITFIYFFLYCCWTRIT
jgi:hypothetical protein